MTPDDIDEKSKAAYDRVGAAIRRMAESGVTPYLLPNDNLKRGIVSLGMASAILKKLGHQAFASVLDADIVEISELPNLESDMKSYLQGLMNVTNIALRIIEYCNENDGLEEVRACVRSRHAKRMGPIAS